VGPENHIQHQVRVKDMESWEDRYISQYVVQVELTCHLAFFAYRSRGPALALILSPQPELQEQQCRWQACSSFLSSDMSCRWCRGLDYRHIYEIVENDTNVIKLSSSSNAVSCFARTERGSGCGRP
jgi:hypothetical protein